MMWMKFVFPKNSVNRTQETTSKSKVSREIFKIILFLFSLGFICKNFGNFSNEINGLLAFICIFIFLSLFSPIKNSKIKVKNLFFLSILLLVLFYMFTESPNVIAKLAFFSLFLVVFYLIIRSDNKSEVVLPVLIVTSAFYTLFIIIYLNIPFVWNLIQRFSNIYSKNIAKIIGRDLLLGSTPSGISILILFCMILVGYMTLSKRKDWRLIFGIFLLSFLMNAVYIILQFPILDIIKKVLNDDYITPIDIHIIFVLFLILPALITVRKKRMIKNVSMIPFPEKKHVKYFILCTVLLLFSSFFVFFQPQKKASSSGVLLYDQGYLDWKKPEQGKYGQMNWGMFGVLPEFLEAIRFRVRTEKTLSHEVLENVDILVLINLDKKISSNEKKEIWDFVKKGGSLLCLGDHTGLSKIREPFNDLLRPVKIEYNFDSGHYLRNFWKYDFEFVQHPINRTLYSDVDTGIGVGASLSISPTVQPIIIGKYGFSDDGNPNDPRNAYLGDRKYNKRELLGDIVLVAESHYGRGKVLVFGDTSSFQNLSFVQNHIYVENIFNYLSIKKNWILNFKNPLSLLLLISGFILLAVSPVRKTILFYFTLSLGILVMMGMAHLLNPRFSSRVDLIPNIAWIDVSHMGRIGLKLMSEKSIMGLFVNLIKNDLNPLIIKKVTSESLEKGKLFISIAPAKKFAEREIEVLKTYIENGGIFILAVGHEEKEGAKSLLDFVGLDISSIPLGPVSSEMNNLGLNFVNAWPIEMEKDDMSSKVLCIYKNERFNFPLIITKNIGKGKFILVSDSCFFCDVNFESYNYYFKKNIEFLRSIIIGKNLK